MSGQRIETRDRSQQLPDAPSAGSPPLNAGDHLSMAEFERRYKAHPEIKKAELIEGVVYMPSPTRLKQHGEPHAQLIAWLGVYAARIPGATLADNATVRLDFENEVQPDALLRLEPEFGGQSRVTEDDYLAGPPELIIEVAASSAAYDLHEKHRVYARNGVLEYLVVQMYERRLDWLALRQGVYEPLLPDPDSILRSEIFPGLWLQPAAFWSSDLAAMLAILEEGLASPEYAAFVARLQARRSDASA